MSLITIMDEMADQIRSVVEAVTDIDVQVESRMVFNPTPPCIDLYPGDTSRDELTAAFDDVTGAYVFTVRARVNTADTDAGQDLLLALMDDANALSLAGALLDEPTLNGYASSLHVRDFSGYRLFEHPSGEGAYLGFQFTTLVIPAES